MMLSGGRLEATDFIRPLSLESLQYFAEGHDSNTMNGKFVRVGGMIMVSVFINYGQIDPTGVQRQLEHIDILKRLMQDEVVFERAVDESALEECLTSDPAPVNDAGLTIMLIGNDRQPSELMMIGDSGFFGQAGPEARQRTIEIARTALGPTVMVG